LETYDDAAFERFCSGLVNAGFSPVGNTDQRLWSGPIRASLQSLTDATRMQISFYPGWPLRYAHVVVDGLRTEHAARGTICLWAEDDPAQIAGRDLEGLWGRIDEWATKAQQGFGTEDRALDAFMLFDEQNTYQAELPFGDLIQKGTNGYIAALFATKRGQTLMVEPGSPPNPATDDNPQLMGVFYLRDDIGAPPRNLDDVRSALTRRQAQDLERGLAAREPAILAEPSGGYDFIVLAWPRHDREHDAVVVGFQGRGDSLRSSAMSATPNDIPARQRRAGPDADLLSDKTVLIAGAGSVGGHVAVALASSGVGTIHLHDNDDLKTANLVRHIGAGHLVGYRKTLALAMAIEDHAPWTTIERHDDLPTDPTDLSAQIANVDLVIDCTGVFSVSAALAETCRRDGVPLITGALFHQGSLARVQRQADGDTPIGARPADPRYFELPAEDPSGIDSGFLELGCTAPINAASPVAVLLASAEIACTATDLLAGRQERPDERIIVIRAMSAPFDRPGTLYPSRPDKTDTK
jgi:molybdopterin/thiamine biosynthesis adenylyltransferase